MSGLRRCSEACRDGLNRARTWEEIAISNRATTVTRPVVSKPIRRLRRATAPVASPSAVLLCFSATTSSSRLGLRLGRLLGRQLFGKHAEVCKEAAGEVQHTISNAPGSGAAHRPAPSSVHLTHSQVCQPNVASTFKRHSQKLAPFQADHSSTPASTSVCSVKESNQSLVGSSDSQAMKVWMLHRGGSGGACDIACCKGVAAVVGQQQTSSSRSIKFCFAAPTRRQNASQRLACNSAAPLPHPR